MAKRLAALSKRATREIPRVEMIPVDGDSEKNPLRLKELDDLVAQIVLMGRRKVNRAIRKGEESKDAA